MMSTFFFKNKQTKKKCFVFITGLVFAFTKTFKPTLVLLALMIECFYISLIYAPCLVLYYAHSYFSETVVFFIYLNVLFKNTQRVKANHL